ncbi:MAG: DNA repair protein RadC [Candidatus Omnitrophica bacterium]|nr:DNA repair protein RadC [Candidatus Omnitrophota bacterium]
MEAHRLKTRSWAHRPRERLLKHGTQALKDEDLLAVVLGSGVAGRNVQSLARHLLQGRSLHELAALSSEELQAVRGIGPARACQLKAAFELAHRARDRPAASITSPEQVAVLVADLQTRRREHFVALYLDARKRLLKRHTVSVGTLTASLVHPREVFGPALELGAASVILAHNHPSGDVEASPEDRALTERLIAAGQLMGIEVLDHLIVGGGSYSSVFSSRCQAPVPGTGA